VRIEAKPQVHKLVDLFEPSRLETSRLGVIRGGRVGKTRKYVERSRPHQDCHPTHSSFPGFSTGVPILTGLVEGHDLGFVRVDLHPRALPPFLAEMDHLL